MNRFGFLLFVLTLSAFSFSLVAAAPPVIESIIVGNDRPVQQFTKFDAIPLPRVVVRSSSALRALFCTCSVDKGDCKPEYKQLWRCQGLSERRELQSGDLHTFSGFSQTLEPGAYKVWVEVIEVKTQATGNIETNRGSVVSIPSVPTGRFWYNVYKNNPGRGIIKISSQNALVFTSVQFLAVLPIVYTAPNENLLIKLEAGDVLEGQCFTLKSEKQLQPGTQVAVGENLYLTFKPSCPVVGDFKLIIGHPSDPDNVETYRISIPGESKMLIVARAGKLPIDVDSFKKYLQRAAGDAFTIKMAEIGTTQEIQKPELPKGVYYLAEAASTSQGGLLDAASIAKGLRKLRSKVKPRYIMIIGDKDDIPFFRYDRRTPTAHGFPEEYFLSDHGYMVDGDDSRSTDLGVSVSRVPFSTSDDLNFFFSNTIDFGQVGPPAVLTIQDAGAKFIEESTKNKIMPFYYGVSQCTEDKGCFYAPSACTEVDAGCSTAKFKAFVQVGTQRSRGHLLFQTHGGEDAIIGGLKQLPTGETQYPLLITSLAFNNALLQGTLVTFESCSALFPENPDSIGTAALRDAGAVGVFGSTGKTSVTLLPGVRGRAVSMGDELIRLKNQCGGQETCLKLSYYGDPRLKVKLT